MKKKLAILMAGLLALAMLTGCAAGKSEDSAISENYYSEGSNTSTSYAEAPEAVYDYADDSLKAGDVYESESQQTVDEMYGGRKVIRTYDLTIQTDDFDHVLSAITERLAEFGGYSQSSTVDGKKPTSYGDAGRTATLTLRVPAEKAEEFVEGVKSYGTLLNIRDYTDDITDEYFDTDARLSTLKAELERLQGILVQTDNLADIISLEDRISEVMLEIEQLTGTLKKYDALVNYTTVDVTLYEESLREGPASVKTTGDRISEGFTNTLYGVGTFFTNLFVWFVSALPVLVILAVIAGIVIFIIRRGAKRRSQKRAERAAKAAVCQQAIFEQQKAAYLEQQKAEADKKNSDEMKKEGSDNENSNNESK